MALRIRYARTQQKHATTASNTSVAVRLDGDPLTPEIGRGAARFTNAGATHTLNAVSFSGDCSMTISFPVFCSCFGNATSFVGVNPPGSRNRYVAFLTGIRKLPTHGASNTFSSIPDNAPPIVNFRTAVARPNLTGSRNQK